MSQRSRLERLEKLAGVPSPIASLWDVLTGCADPEDLTPGDRREWQGILVRMSAPPRRDEIEQTIRQLLDRPRHDDEGGTHD